MEVVWFEIVPSAVVVLVANAVISSAFCVISVAWLDTVPSTVVVLEAREEIFSDMTQNGYVL